MQNILLTSFAAIGLSVCTGCAVNQPRGQGQYARIQEPTTLAWYHLYLPVDYVKNNGRRPKPLTGKLSNAKWPLVMTFHGMKPYDNARPQEREWEQQADIYGYIVCAPELRTCNSLVEYPLTREHAYVLEDKHNVIAIMDHVMSTTRADKNKVLSTSWSCGGYLAHYFANRFPDRFCCVATRLSNFSAKLLIEDTVPLYRDRVSVAIFMSDGDFPACKHESQNAVAWYRSRDFRVVHALTIDHMGHRRVPQTAAAFFADQIGIQPLHPVEASTTLSTILMTSYYPSKEQLTRSAPVVPAISPLARGPTQVAGTPPSE